MAWPAALAVPDVMEEEKLRARARRSASMQRRLRELAARHKCIGDVRGLGAMVAVNSSTMATTRVRRPEIAKAVIAAGAAAACCCCPAAATATCCA